MTSGQDLAPSKVGSAESPTPAPTPTPLPTGALGLIPNPSPSPSGLENVPPPELPDLSQLDQAFKQSKAGKETEDYRAHIEWRQLKTRIMYDPAVMSAQAAARTAKTDLEKRNRLRVYYQIAFQRMIALASSPDMVAYLTAARDAHLNQLDQPRVRPSPAPSKTPGPATSPTPSPNEETDGD